MLIVFISTQNIEEAETLARKIIEAKLAACVQILPPMKSFYFRENAVQEDSEHLLLIKTLPEKYDELETFIKSNHRCEVPEIVALKAESVSKSYLKWLGNYLN